MATTLPDPVERYVRQHFTSRGTTPEWRRTFKSTVDAYFDYAGGLEDISPIALQDFLDERCGHLGVNTVRKELYVLRPMIYWLNERGHIDLSDGELRSLDRIRPPRGSFAHAVPRPYSPKEVDQIWAVIAKKYPRTTSRSIDLYARGATKNFLKVRRHAVNLQWTAITMLGLHAGLRRKEIFELSPEDADPENQYLVVRHNKNDPQGIRGRNVPWTADLRRAVDEWLEFRGMVDPPHDSMWLALHRRSGSYYTDPMGIEQLHQTYRHLGFHLHRLRHTYATEMLRAGVPLEHVSRLLGHSSITTTMGYLKLIDDDTEASVIRAERAFSKRARSPFDHPTKDEEA